MLPKISVRTFQQRRDLQPAVEEAVVLSDDEVKFINKERPDYIVIKANGTVKHLSQWKLDKYYEIAKKYEPKYRTQLWCAACIKNLITFVFKHYDAAAAHNTK